MDSITITENAYQRFCLAMDALASSGRWDSFEEFADEEPDAGALAERIEEAASAARLTATLTGDTEAAAEGLVASEWVEEVEMFTTFTDTVLA